MTAPYEIPPVTQEYLEGLKPREYRWQDMWQDISITADSCPHCGGTSFNISTSDGITTKTCNSCGHSMQG